MLQQIDIHTETSVNDTIKVDTSAFVWVNENEIQSFTHWSNSYDNEYNSVDLEQNLPPLDFRLRDKELGSGLFSLYVIILVIGSILYRKNMKAVDLIAKSMFSNSSLFQLIDGRGGLNSLFSVVLFLIGLLVFSVFTIQFMKVYHITIFGSELFESWSTIFLIFLVAVSLFFVKTVVVILSSWIFDESVSFNAYLSVNVVAIQFLGFILFPLTVLITYGNAFDVNWLVNLGVLILIVAFVYRLTRIFFLALKRTNSQLFHIMLYICALEILPLLVASKWIFAFGVY